MSSLLFPGSDVLENFLQTISDKIIAMVDEILTEKADAMVYDIMQPKIEECMKAIFSSSPVHLEAAKMFNKEIFPIYDRSLKDLAGAKQIIDGVEGDAKKAFDKYTEAIVNASKSGGDATAAIEKAKQTFKEDMKKIDDEKVKYDAEGGNKMRQFLLNKDNAFKPDEEMAVLENYLTDPSAPAMTALEQIILNTEKTYETYGKQIEEAAKNEEALRKARIAKLRIPGSTACPAISAMYKHASTNRNCAIDNEKQKLEDIKKERADLKKEAEIVAETVTEPVAEPADKPKSGFFSNLFKKNDANATKKGGRSTKKLRRRRNRTNRKR